VADPGRYDITIHQGATFVLPLHYKDGTGASVNLTGHTVSGTLWNNNGTGKLANFTTQWTVQASGMLELRLTASGTSIVAEQGQYDVLVTEPGGDKYYLLQGTAFFDPGLSWKG
jgi:hypothetical protein